MATGPDHYREAEKLIAAANQRLTGNDAEWLHTPERRAELRAEAAIHATLAHAAATAMNDSATTRASRDYEAWQQRVASESSSVGWEPRP